MDDAYTPRPFPLRFAFIAASLAALSPAPLRAAAVPPAGTFYQQLDEDPSTLNEVTAVDAYAFEIQGNIFDSLLTLDENTYEWLPALAEKYEVSKDGMTFTFHIRDGVKWSDGQPLTAEDVKYSFDVFYEGRFQAPAKRVYLDAIKEVKILDPKTVQFTAKEVYFKNLEVIATQGIIPKHFYGTGDPADPKFTRELIGTGSYMLSEWTKGQRITLKRNPTFWGDSLPYYKDRSHFAKVVYRIVKDETVSMEMLKKGDLDFLDLRLHPEIFAKETKGPEWGKKVFAVEADNKSPELYNFNFIGWNLKNPLFADRKVRTALTYLVDRQLMNDKFRYGFSELAHGPFGNKCPGSSPKVKPIPYDPKKGLALLKEAGWSLGPTGLVKTIDGKETPFSFTVLCASPDREKYLTLMKEDMSKVGITLNIKIIEWNSFTKALDERRFDAVFMGWGGGTLEGDPTQIWHSKSIPTPGSNFISYSNPEVDQLIDKLKVTLDRKKRIEIYRNIDEIIAADQPYTFMFNEKYWLYGHSNRVVVPQKTLKFALGVDTWSAKPAAATAGD